MTALAAPRPALPDLGDDDFVHAFCCDPDMAVCGADVSGSDVVPDTSLDEVCPTCIAAASTGGRCARPGCPGRFR